MLAGHGVPLLMDHRMPSEAAEVAGFRAELARLERHPALMSSPRQKQLLRYLFEECLAGRCDHISQYTIAFECFGRGHEFDAAANTVVRSHALRLRKTLKKLARPDGCHRILMAERGYGLRFGCAMEAEARTTPPLPTRQSRGHGARAECRTRN
ncbi:MAG: hypothetical protein ACO3JG_07240 [Luteolibacter sp.]